MKTFYLALASLTTLNIFASEASKPKEFTVKPQQYVLLSGSSKNSYIGSSPYENDAQRRIRLEGERNFLNYRGKEICEYLGLHLVQRAEKGMFSNKNEDTYFEINIICRNDSDNTIKVTRSPIEKTEWDIDAVLPLVVSYQIKK